MTTTPPRRTRPPDVPGPGDVDRRGGTARGDRGRRGGRGRRERLSLRLVLRFVVVGLAAVVTALAAVPPDGTAAEPTGSRIPGGSVATVPPPPPVPPSGTGPDVVPGTEASPGPEASPGTGPVAGQPPGSTAGPPGIGAPVPVPVRPPGAGRRAPGAEYAWPMVPVPDVVTPFRAPTFRFGRGHRGADLAGEPGRAVLAAREGTVAFAGRVAGRPVVSVDHPDGLRTTYEPVLATVRAGDRVDVGDPLGVLAAGHTGCVSACLHWGVRRGRVDYLDPLVLVRPPGLRLLPVGAG